MKLWRCDCDDSKDKNLRTWASTSSEMFAAMDLHWTLDAFILKLRRWYKVVVEHKDLPSVRGANQTTRMIEVNTTRLRTSSP
jgi:hypothetical protein